MMPGDAILLTITFVVVALVVALAVLVIYKGDWMLSWWRTWCILRELDPEQRAILTGKFDISDFVEVDRPE
jgi:hypothetical protein